MNNIIKSTVLQIIIFGSLSSSIGLKLASISKTYNKGVQAYSGERWSECIVQFEESLHLYELYKRITINCRLKCNTLQEKTVLEKNTDNLKLYEDLFNIRNCLNKCHDVGFEQARLEKSIDDATLSNMQKRKPYEYLHMCYFQMNLLPKAASAVYTYLVANPGDETMQENLRFYLDRPQVERKEVVDLLGEDYVTMHKLGLEAYEKNDWAETIASMEKAITDYLLSEDSCRVECEHQPQQEWSPEYTITISNNIASLLDCRQHCQDRLKAISYNSGIEFLADTLNYLQISHYRLDQLKDAVKAVQSYLLLMPDDEDMLENEQIYASLTTEDAFVERSDIANYFHRDQNEKKLLDIFHYGNGKSDKQLESNAI